jgi:hypothetical protein
VYDRGPQGLNRYSYALNNPIIYRDPTGQYVDADLDECTYGDCAYDDGPTASGNVTGSAQQIEEGSATVHHYYGTHSLAYWQGVAGGSEPDMTVWEMAQAGGMLLAYCAGPVGFAVSVAIAPYKQVAVEYYREHGYNTLATVVEHGDIIIEMGVEAGITKVASKFDDLVEAASSKVSKGTDPFNIKYTQATASPNFSEGGHTITSTVADLKTGKITPDDLPTIKVVKYKGKWWSLDNRRLVAFKQAGVKEIPIQKVSLKDPAILREFQKKFNPIDGIGDWIVITPRKGRELTEKVLREYGKIR